MFKKKEKYKFLKMYFTSQCVILQYLRDFSPSNASRAATICTILLPDIIIITCTNAIFHTRAKMAFVQVTLRLYGGMWRYAGLNDMNRIIGANFCTTVVMVMGTLLFIRRMQITYYAIGGAIPTNNRTIEEPLLTLK